MGIGQIIARVLIVVVLAAICAFSAAFSNTMIGYLPIVVLILVLITCFRINGQNVLMASSPNLASLRLPDGTRSIPQHHPNAV